MTDQKKLEIRFLVRTTISYIRRGPFPSLACDSIRGASLIIVHHAGTSPRTSRRARSASSRVGAASTCGTSRRKTTGGAVEFPKRTVSPKLTVRRAALCRVTGGWSMSVPLRWRGRVKSVVVIRA